VSIGPATGPRRWGRRGPVMSGTCLRRKMFRSVFVRRTVREHTVDGRRPPSCPSRAFDFQDLARVGGGGVLCYPRLDSDDAVQIAPPPPDAAARARGRGRGRGLRLAGPVTDGVDRRDGGGCSDDRGLGRVESSQSRHVAVVVPRREPDRYRLGSDLGHRPGRLSPIPREHRRG